MSDLHEEGQETVKRGRGRPRKGTSGDAPTALPSRADALQSVVDLFLHEWKSYCNDENCDNPTDQFWDACKDVVDLFSDGDIPHEHRELAQAVENLGREAWQFEERSDANNFYPHKAFWKAVEEVNRLARNTATPEKKPPLEPMTLLQKQGVNPAQIALIWDCSMDDVNRELANPGSVCTAAYCAAAEARRFKQSKSERFGREIPVVDHGEVASMLEAGTDLKEICETTGATPDQVSGVQSRIRRSPVGA